MRRLFTTDQHLAEALAFTAFAVVLLVLFGFGHPARADAKPPHVVYTAAL